MKDSGIRTAWLRASPRDRAAVLTIFAVLAAAGAGVILWRECANDFPEFYAAGLLAGSDRLYDTAAIHALERAYRPESAPLPFVRLPWYAGLLSLLTFLPYPLARALWLAANAVALTAALYIWDPESWKTRAAVAAVFCPVYYLLWLGQDTALFLLFAAISMRLLASGRDTAAGLALSLCALKFNLALPLPFAVLGLRRYRAAAAACAGLAAQIAISFVLQGPDWPVRYLVALRDPVSKSPALMPNFRGVLLPLPLEAAAAFLAVVLVFFIARRGHEPTAFAAALLAGVLASHHAYHYDLVVLIPALALAVADAGAFRLALVPLIPLVYALPRLRFNPAIALASCLCVVGPAAALLIRMGRYNAGGGCHVPYRRTDAAAAGVGVGRKEGAAHRPR